MKYRATLVLVVALLFLTGCKDKIEPGVTEIKRPLVTGANVTQIVPTRITDDYVSTGTITAKTTSAVASRMMGAVTTLLVREGERVQKGQLLLTLDDRDIRQKVAAAKAGLEEAQRALGSAQAQESLAKVTLRRYQNLYEEKAVARQTLDQITTQAQVASLEVKRLRQMVQQARAGLDEARAYLAFTRVSAPVTGVVAKKYIDLGSMTAPGTPLFSIEDRSLLRLETQIDESLAGRLKVGDPVEVEIPSLGERVKGAITELVPAVDPSSRSFLIKVNLPGKNLQSGLFAKVHIPLGTKEAIVLPEALIVRKGELTGVYSVDEHDVISYRLVRLGRAFDGKVEILSGLSPGDRVISGGLERVVDGGLLVEGKNP